MARAAKWTRGFHATPTVSGYKAEWGVVANPIGFTEGSTLVRTVGRVTCWSAGNYVQTNYYQAMGGAYGYVVWFDDRRVNLPADTTLSNLPFLVPEWQEQVLWMNFSPPERVAARPQDTLSIFGWRTPYESQVFDTSTQRRCVSKTPGQKCRVWVFTSQVSDFLAGGDIIDHRYNFSLSYLVLDPPL